MTCDVASTVGWWSRRAPPLTGRAAEIMGFHPLIDTNRISLLVCDGCDALMTLRGDKAPKRHSESDPEDRAPHYGTAADLRATATDAGWTKNGDTWMCASCSRPPPSTST